MIEDESAPYDMRIHSNSSALAWTKFFREHNPECNLDDNVMLGWFANAMMAMHDHIYQSTQPEQSEQEPVAWLIKDNDTEEEELMWVEPTLHKSTPLYTAPPKREPIEDGELEVWYSQHAWAMDKQEYMWGFRDAEKAHGITGGVE